ncbi:trace amine-associated receptor 1-like [Diretmus argenteus]
MLKHIDRNSENSTDAKWGTMTIVMVDGVCCDEAQFDGLRPLRMNVMHNQQNGAMAMGEAHLPPAGQNITDSVVGEQLVIHLGRPSILDPNVGEDLSCRLMTRTASWQAGFQSHTASFQLLSRNSVAGNKTAPPFCNHLQPRPPAPTTDCGDCYPAAAISVLNTTGTSGLRSPHEPALNSSATSRTRSPAPPFCNHLQPRPPAPTTDCGDCYPAAAISVLNTTGTSGLRSPHEPALNSSATSRTRPMPLTSKAVLFNTLLSSIALLTVMLNLLVIISISHFRQLHTPTNVLLVSLAVSDLLVGLLVIPLRIYSLQSCWFLGNLVCALFYFVTFIVMSASVGSMVLISVDRYVAICNPLRYSSMMTTSRVKICVCLCWICSVFYNCMILKDYLPDLFSPCQRECVVVINYVTGAVDLIFTFVGPVTVIIVLYVRVFMVAVSQARVMRSQIAAVKSSTVTVITKKSEIRAARTLGIVLLVFLGCIFPYYCPSLAGEDTSTTGTTIEIWLFYFNSCMNPLIYAFFYPWFRKAMKLIVSLQILQPGSCEARMM